jgi:hypothetical protein
MVRMIQFNVTPQEIVFGYLARELSTLSDALREAGRI